MMWTATSFEPSPADSLPDSGSTESLPSSPSDSGPTPPVDESSPGSSSSDSSSPSSPSPDPVDPTDVLLQQLIVELQSEEPTPGESVTTQMVCGTPESPCVTTLDPGTTALLGTALSALVLCSGALLVLGVRR